MRVRFVHWNAKEATSTLALLSEAGFQPEYDETVDSTFLRMWRADPPDCFVIDLSRLPSRGREIAIAVRQSPKTRHVPVVFCAGDAEKVRLIREALPDAVFCTTTSLIRNLKKVRPLSAPLKPIGMVNRFSSRTAAQKLGMKEGGEVQVVDPPLDLEAVLGTLPSGTEFVEHDAPVTLCFVHSMDSLRETLSLVRVLAAQTKLWICWRKKGAPGHSGVMDGLVRETGIELGLVDYKICSINAVWTAMLFARKK